MGVTFFTREFTDAIMTIAYELEKMNELKETELILNKKQIEDLSDENEKLKRIMQEKYIYFMNYFSEVREDIDYELYSEVMENIKELDL